MIQKKSLKDAIQNPEIISVVGGLLPVANNTQNGLIDKTFVPLVVSDFSTPKYLRISKKQGLSFFLRYHGSGVNSNLYYISMTNSPKKTCAIKKVVIIESGNILYAKENNQYIYLSKSWGSSLRSLIMPMYGDSNIIFDFVTELPSDVENIQILD